MISPLLDSIKIINLPHYVDNNGELVVMEGLISIPFLISRVFVVRAFEGCVRGQHAHRACSQFLICTNGVVEVLCDDGVNTASYILNNPNLGLLIPAGIWCQEKYIGYDVVLTVLSDRFYESEDYIHEYQEYLLFRQNHHNESLQNG